MRRASFFVRGGLAALATLTAILHSHAARATTPESSRASCSFCKGDKVEKTLGISAKDRKAIPIKNVIVVMQENRSFDHYFGKLAEQGQPDAEGWPAAFSNKDKRGTIVKPFHLTSTCLEKSPPHQWNHMHTAFNGGKLDQFVLNAASGTSDGHYALGYYDKTDIPFYYWLASTWALADHYFASDLSGTWSNRAFLYAGTSDGVKWTGQRALSWLQPTIFSHLTWSFVSWGVYTDGKPRQDVLGWTRKHIGVHSIDKFFGDLKKGKLPKVAFIDPSGLQDEHPPNNIQGGEAWARTIYKAALESPQWPNLALIFTYDEGGGLADHVVPPTSCAPDKSHSDLTQLGFRVPLIVVSPYAKRRFVSHVKHEHTSIIRFIELLHNLPAITSRDANSDALLDLFDFSKAEPKPGEPPAAGTGGCTSTNTYEEKDE